MSDEDAIHCITGLSYKRLNAETNGDHPGPDDIVSVRYEARSADGSLIEHSGEPQSWSLQTVAPGLAEAVQLMARGDRLRAWIPPELSSSQLRELTPGTVTFDLELIGFTRVTEPAALPDKLRSPRSPIRANRRDF